MARIKHFTGILQEDHLVAIVGNMDWEAKKTFPTMTDDEVRGWFKARGKTLDPSVNPDDVRKAVARM